MPLMGVIQLRQNWKKESFAEIYVKQVLLFDPEFVSKQDIDVAERKASLCFYMETLKTISML